MTAMAVVLLSVGVGGGCQSRPATAADLALEPSGQRLAEAHRLAVEGQRAQKAGDSARAMQYYQQSLEQSQELHAVWNNMGMLLMEEQNYIDAVEMFRIAADLAPFDPQPHYNIGLAYDEANYPARAMEFYERALERDPRYIDALRAYLLAAKRLDVAEPSMLQRVRTALLIDRDPTWRAFHEREQIRIESQIRDAQNDPRPRVHGQ